MLSMQELRLDMLITKHGGSNEEGVEKQTGLWAE